MPSDVPTSPGWSDVTPDSELGSPQGQTTPNCVPCNPECQDQCNPWRGPCEIRPKPPAPNPPELDYGKLAEEIIKRMPAPKNGKDGENGKDGQVGPRGPPGPAGTVDVIIRSENGDVLYELKTLRDGDEVTVPIRYFRETQ